MDNSFLLKHWYPYRLNVQQREMSCEWIHLKDIPFTDPFFDETLIKARSSKINSSQFRPLSNLLLLEEWGNGFPTVAPTAFIFHISRCGSTLLSQLLGLHDACISLAEVPFFDGILRLPIKNKNIDHHTAEVLLDSAIRFYGQQRTGNEQHLFIKMDSWHIFFWKQIRRLYPKVPFILLYRRPDEVIRSNRKQRGMQAVPGLIEPEIFGFTASETNTGDLDRYMAKVLERYFTAYLETLAYDHATLLLNYQEGPEMLFNKTTQFSRLSVDETLLKNVVERSKYHSKYPQQTFFEKREHDAIPPYMEKAFNLYKQLEQLRTNPETVKHKMQQ